MTQTPRVAVAGGGLAGLVAARHLAGAGLDVTLFERAENVGGRVWTHERKGFRFDRGFQVLFPSYPAVRAELDLDALDLRRFAPGACIARPGSRSTLSDPIREPKALPATLASREVSTGDKLRVARLAAELARRDPEAIFETAGSDTTIEEYLRERGFSDRFIGNFVAPFYGGICLDRSLSTSSRVFEYTFRTLLTSRVAVPATGMAAIPAQLAQEARVAGASIELGTEVTDVSSEGTNGESATVTTADGEDAADAVVVATDPLAASELTGVESIPTDARSCVTQYYELPGGTDLETGKRLLLNATKDGPNHVVPHSAVAPEYAPDGAELLSATYLGEREESDDELAAITRETLEAWYPERRFDALEPRRTDRIEFAQFAQPPGIYERLPDPRDPDGPVYLAGDYTRWSSIQAAIRSGRTAARAVLEDVA
ncbi:NAD(P)/FAD-dependent oxidoreductase [Natronococcus occultus]|uniref:Phytoene dehydrogenase-like oxidoreductase n=1 Tax=Natronococcus occultus SP4 TaxID=694430 RepID=L0JVX0_9EURY|nr:NAD(P)/FAD-dependent oxidoreductase [Natronococcus occultus]AGB36445.1 phytoene dehydrogenase-like oxidoreductase [Natronococcus occultus SP4]